VNDAEELEESLISIDEDIEHILKNRITRPYSTCKNIGERLWGLEGHYRTRGTLKFLLEADADAFFADLAREALTYRTLLKAYEAKLDVPATRVNGSTYHPLASAIAIGNFELANEIDALMRRQPGKGDDEELFAFTSLLRSLVRDQPKDIIAAKKRLAEIAGENERYAAVIEIGEAIEGKDEKTFNSALTTYLSAIDRPTRDDLDEMDPGEDRVSIEALAFIQLAKRANLKVRVKHPQVPPPLQKPDAALPKDGYPAWP